VAAAELAFAMRPGTLIVIAHRPASARRAERILVLDGHLPTAGTHHELLVTSPLYRELLAAGRAPADPSGRST
jgi:ATP-binding cassette subfamily C protein